MKYIMKVREVRNLTPHDVVIVKDDGSTLVYHPESVPARVDVTLREIDSVSEFPMFEETYGEVINLPAPKYGTALIVSGLVCSACPDRVDLVHPVGLIKDDEGHAIGCKGLCAPNAVLWDC